MSGYVEEKFWSLDREDLPLLFTALRQRGYTLLGPTVRDGAIVYDELTTVSDLPIGWTDEQDGGMYRLTRRDDHALFGYAVGPHSWKRFLLPPVIRLWQAARTGSGSTFTVLEEPVPETRYAFLGVRACEIHAIAVQDRVLLGGAHADPVYQARRDGIFVVAVNCGQAGGTCFCVSMQTGPKARAGFDLALTEVVDTERHYFVVEVGSEQGAALLRDIPHSVATAEQVVAAEERITRTAQQMGRVLDTDGIKDLLYQNYEHPRWEEVATRCLTCGNCTMVCPTCFCTTVEDVTNLAGDQTERVRRWDSCFTLDFSYIHGGSVRVSAKSRYRQWLTHKLATWIDQFGTSGCVGCGRCITWCPVGIDITEEVRAIRANAPVPGARESLVRETGGKADEHA